MQYDEPYTSRVIIAHWTSSKIKVENRRRSEIATAVETMIILLERDRDVSYWPGRDSLESLRPLDTSTSCKGSRNAFVLEAEGEDMKRAIKLQRKKKLRPSMNKRTIED